MARPKRDNDYVELIEHVLGGVQVFPREPWSRASRADSRRRARVRRTASAIEEVVVPVGSGRKKSEKPR